MGLVSGLYRQGPNVVFIDTDERERRARLALRTLIQEHGAVDTLRKLRTTKVPKGDRLLQTILYDLATRLEG